MKGHLNETDIGQLSLLPPRDTRAVINTLLKLGYVENVIVPMSGAGQKSGNLASGPTQMMYGTNYKKVQGLLSTKILHTIVNLASRYDELGRVIQITRDLNTLYF